MKITNHLESVKKIFIDYPNAAKEYRMELKKINQERQDLLHALEFGKLNAIQLMKIVKDLKDVQIKRRKIKNNLEVLDKIERFSNQFNKRKFRKKDINNLINLIERITSRERTYTMRIRTDLQFLIDKYEEY